MNQQKGSIYDRLIDDTYRYYIQLLIISLLLGLISTVMCVLNIFTQKHTLMLATLVFAVVCFINAAIIYCLKKASTVSYLLFETSIVGLFTYFLITGGTAGFSPVWICILPACGMLLLGMRRGATICSVMLAEVIFLLWLPLGNSLLLYPFTPEFRMRFPVVYCSFFAIGYFFEKVRFVTYRELQDTKEQYRKLSHCDALTSVPNRLHFQEQIRQQRLLHSGPCGFLMADIDHFKQLNDLHGHLFGDEVLIGVANCLQQQARSNDVFCRWGGEEFILMVRDCPRERLPEVAERLRSAIEKLEFPAPEGEQPVHITISVGSCWVPESSVMDENRVIRAVDIALYSAKDAGRNCIRVAEEIPSSIE